MDRRKPTEMRKDPQHFWNTRAVFWVVSGMELCLISVCRVLLRLSPQCHHSGAGSSGEG